MTSLVAFREKIQLCKRGRKLNKTGFRDNLEVLAHELITDSKSKLLIPHYCDLGFVIIINTIRTYRLNCLTSINRTILFLGDLELCNFFVHPSNAIGLLLFPQLSVIHLCKTESCEQFRVTSSIATQKFSESQWLFLKSINHEFSTTQRY